MAEEAPYSSELSPLSHSTTTTLQTPGFNEGSYEITEKQLIRTSQLSRVHLDNNLVGCDQAGVIDSDAVVSGIEVQKKSDSFVGSGEIIMNVAEIEQLGSDEISNKVMNSDGFSGICMNVQENYVANWEDADEIVMNAVDSSDTGEVSGPEFDGLNTNVFQIGQLGSEEIPKKMVDMDETGQVTEPKLVNDDVGFERNEEISEFLELKDEVGKFERDNSSEIVLLGSCDSQSGANCEVASLVSKDKPVLDQTTVPATVMNIQMIDDTVVLKISETERESNGKGGIKDSCNVVVNSEKMKYSKKELEKLRFVGGKEGQKKLWRDVYNGFSGDMKTEYDALSNSKQKKHGVAAYDHHHHQIAGKRSKHDRGTLGDESKNMSFDAELNRATHSSTFDGDSNAKCGDDLIEEWIEDDESDDEYQSIRRPAFLVEGEPDFESGPPEDGLEYLRRVRWEAAQIPNVKVAKLDKSKLKEQSVYMPKIPDIEKCPPHLAPLREWEEEFIAEFLNLRLALYHLVDNSDAASAESETMVFCRPESKKRTYKCLASFESPTGGGPTLSTLLAMDPATRVMLLNKRIILFESATSLSKDDCDWFFALCAVVETPLDADTSAALRCLLRRCAKLRAEKSEVDEELIMLNILVTIAGKCFGQGES